MKKYRKTFLKASQFNSEHDFPNLGSDDRAGKDHLADIKLHKFPLLEIVAFIHQCNIEVTHLQ